MKNRHPIGPESPTFGSAGDPHGKTARPEALSLAKRWEPACKPGSVENGHSSGMCVTAHLEQPTRGPRGPRVAERTACPPIWSCSGWGLPCRRCCQRRGALLPHHFTLTAHAPQGHGFGGMFSVALSVGSRPPGVTWHPVHRSPDFPPSRINGTATIRPTPMTLKDRSRRRTKQAFRRRRSANQKLNLPGFTDIVFCFPAYLDRLSGGRGHSRLPFYFFVLFELGEPARYRRCRTH